MAQTKAETQTEVRENGHAELPSKKPSFFSYFKIRNWKMPIIPWLVELEGKVATLLSLLLKALVFIVLTGLFTLLYREMKQQKFTMEAFHVPKTFEEGGFDGIVVANRILDRVQEIKKKAASQKVDSLQFNSDLKPEMNVSVMGFGISLQSIIYYTREMLGRENRSIGGELTELDTILQLKLRVTGMAPVEFDEKLSVQNRSQALQNLFSKAAEHILMQTDPYRLAIYQTSEQRYAESLQTIRYLLNDLQQDPEWAYLAWGNLLRSRGKNEAAVAKFQQAIKVNPSFPLPYYNLGWTYRYLGRPEEAIPPFLKSVELTPDKGEYWNALAWAYFYNKQYRKGHDAITKATEVEPNSPWVWSNRGEMEMQMISENAAHPERTVSLMDTASLIHCFQQVHKLNPESSDGCLSLAGAFFFAGDLPNALKMIQLAIELNPENIGALNRYRGYMYRNAKNYSEALRANRLILASSRKHKNKWQEQSALNHIAMCKYSLMEYDSALIYVNQAIALDPNQSYPYTTLAETYGFLGKEDLFYKALEKAVDKGHSLQELMDGEPYLRYSAQDRFQELLKRND